MNEPERIAQLELATEGDADALQRLIIHYHPQLRTALDGLMDRAARSFVDPDDVLQEAYASAYQTITGCCFDGPGGFYKWLERIALNKLKDQQRAAGRQKRDHAREIRSCVDTGTSYPDLVQRLASPDSTPSRQVARGEAVAAVVSSLARLTDDQRQVVRLRFLEGRSVADVAAHLGKTEPAVHMLCHRGLKSLRGLMASISHYLTRL